MDTSQNLTPASAPASFETSTWSSSSTGPSANRTSSSRPWRTAVTSSARRARIACARGMLTSVRPPSRTSSRTRRYCRLRRRAAQGRSDGADLAACRVFPASSVAGAARLRAPRAAGSLRGARGRLRGEPISLSLRSASATGRARSASSVRPSSRWATVSARPGRKVGRRVGTHRPQPGHNGATASGWTRPFARSATTVAPSASAAASAVRAAAASAPGSSVAVRGCRGPPRPRACGCASSAVDLERVADEPPGEHIEQARVRPGERIISRATTSPPSPSRSGRARAMKTRPMSSVSSRPPPKSPRSTRRRDPDRLQHGRSRSARRTRCAPPRRR
jgi:hypothetical protein